MKIKVNNQTMEITKDGRVLYDGRLSRDTYRPGTTQPDAAANPTYFEADVDGNPTDCAQWVGPNRQIILAIGYCGCMGTVIREMTT